MENRKVQLAELIETPITGEWGNEITDVNNQHIVKVIRTTNFTNNGEIDYSDITLRDIEYTKCEKKKLKYGDIILEKSGGTDLNPVGRVVFFDKNDPNDVYLTNNFTTTLRVKDNKINSRFLLLFLLYNYKYKGVHKFYNKTTGIQNLQVSNLIKNTYVPLPEIKIQSAIVEILDKIKNMIKKREKQILLFDELVKSRFIEMFGDFENSTPIGDVCTIKARIGWQGLSKKEYLLSGEYRLITGVDFNKGRINFENCYYVNKERYEQDDNIKIKMGDVLVTKDGTIGKVAIVDKLDIPATLNSGVFVLRNKDSTLNNIFLVYSLLSEDFKRFIENIKIGATVPHLNQSSFVKYKIKLPPLYLQEEFSQFVEKTDKLKFEAEKSLKEMENLYESLMQKFFKQN